MASVRSLPRVDVALALVLAAYALIEAVVIGAPTAWMVGAPLAVLPLAWRRANPFVVIALVLGSVGLIAALVGEATGTVLPLPLIIVCAYTAGHEAPSGRIALLAAGAIVVALLFGTAAIENSSGEDFVALVVLVGGATAAGFAMRVRQAEAAELRSLTAQLAAERDLRARAAVVEERARLARELHDLVAHSLSLIAVQAGAAEELMARDEARAREALQAVHRSTRAALDEMRRLLCVLRTDGEAPGLAPQPGLLDVGELVAEARQGGLPVELREAGARRDVPAGIDLSAFRIVQEALTNVRKHAGAARTDVLLEYGADEVVVEVSNADLGPGEPSNGEYGGYGITGMHERARIYGGTLEAGRRGERYVVRARLPLRGAPE